MLLAQGLFPVLGALLQCRLAQSAPTGSPVADAGLQERQSTLDIFNDLNSALTGVVDGDVFKNILTSLKLTPKAAEPPAKKPAPQADKPEELVVPWPEREGTRPP